MIGGRVLDASAITDLTSGRSIYGGAFLASANLIGITLAVPTAALQEAWANATPDNEPFLAALLDLAIVVVDDLDSDAAVTSGLLTRDAAAGNQLNAGAAHTVLTAHQRSWPILTADPAPLRSLDPGVPVEVLPVD